MTDKPNDGGPYHSLIVPHENGDINYIAGISTRLELASRFAAAWLPLISSRSLTEESVICAANELGLAMADDLIRREREGA